MLVSEMVSASAPCGSRRMAVAGSASWLDIVHRSFGCSCMVFSLRWLVLCVESVIAGSTSSLLPGAHSPPPTLALPLPNHSVLTCLDTSSRRWPLPGRQCEVVGDAVFVAVYGRLQ